MYASVEPNQYTSTSSRCRDAWKTTSRVWFQRDAGRPTGACEKNTPFM